MGLGALIEALRIRKNDGNALDLHALRPYRPNPMGGKGRKVVKLLHERRHGVVLRPLAGEMDFDPDFVRLWDVFHRHPVAEQVDNLSDRDFSFIGEFRHNITTLGLG